MKSVKLHIFNPEHDIALAYDKARITMPHAAQELRMNLGYLPVLWASGGDAVLVDDIKYAIKAAAPLGRLAADVLFVEKADLRRLPVDEVEPWGWDKRIRTELLDAGIDASCLPSDDSLEAWRTVSDRRHTSTLLLGLRSGIEDKTCGEAFCCSNLQEVEALVARYRSVVVKAPWSSSGRGLRYVSAKIDQAKRVWIEKTLSRQGHVMVEPCYNRVCDFAAEFYSYGDGNVDYSGLSVFHTQKGQYSGNVISSEHDKLFRLGRYVDTSLYAEVVERLKHQLSELLGSVYRGPLGVDMMAVADRQTGRLLLHPCVEVNVRRTMGHVALALSSKSFEFASMMSIIHKVNYQLNIDRIEGQFVNVIYN